ncbi:hypothetical protein GH741_03290 [Aquibacillus halophilus]|uniref:Uncharacterized protein n=1 Tax=Aquibacillus halophilus TaxID=930132 RepID=A0A6A8D7G7_9BACI|nr:hypothetical protein [Aquibacillus halophilus]MRH41695.1 hypothetical protein [Aquibacillus halophilus]
MGLEEGCVDVFDPNDLKEMKPEETFEKEISFKLEVELTNQETANALNGMLEVSFSFQLHDNGRFSSSLLVDLINGKETEILSMDQAKKWQKLIKMVLIE